ncbi:hypothetical protein FVEN_g12919 [Fusarium venenatum]|uniref:Extracellular membrane protein CFEM domain-containing protein n=1 Tax=Fusarium venenatum TaxID=56646 RepID=A0A2L2TIE5_9HYPO|nr:uncharacterized protein FVRRES_04436 [Fusarium venenatum]KAG8353857.1 hypothetical protein FVEN_g12919 [Fusarium venenatum]CEI60000.1 unnamed protein product [Fusarium venenatum]
MKLMLLAAAALIISADSVSRGSAECNISICTGRCAESGLSVIATGCWGEETVCECGNDAFR